MMSDVLLSARGVGKKFCRRLRRSLWYGVQDLGAELLGMSSDHQNLRADEFWANKDITFELRRGQTVGIIGPNGAGKTTLLRMLNGLIRPDLGQIEVRGRMQALIALGAGFNPVLTGRENIYVNAAILGLTKAATDSRLEQIIEFSGVREFIDAPVQSYSSGMAVRLGFAVAAHMDPDILVIDEVLAVGDAAFRKKCYAKLRQFRSKGVGILLVTHDMSQLYNLCDAALLLTGGRLSHAGGVDDVIRAYWEHNLASATSTSAAAPQTSTSSSEATLTEVIVRNEAGLAVTRLATGQRVTVEIHFRAAVPIPNPIFGVGLAVPGADGTYLTAVNTKLSGFATGTLEGEGMVSCEIDAFPLFPGAYELIVTLNDAHGGRYDSREGESAIRLTVEHGAMGAGEFLTKHRWAHVRR